MCVSGYARAGGVCVCVCVACKGSSVNYAEQFSTSSTSIHATRIDGLLYVESSKRHAGTVLVTLKHFQNQPMP